MDQLRLNVQGRRHSFRPTSAVIAWICILCSDKLFVSMVEAAENCSAILSTKDGETCNTNPFAASPDVLCSDRGDCGADGCCVCEEGWRGISDFVNGDGIDCQINYFLSKSLWGILLLQVVVYLVLYFKKITVKVDYHFETKEVQNRKGRDYKMESGVIAAFVAYFLMAPLIGLLAIMKIATDGRIGGDLFITILWYLGRGIFWILAQYHQNKLLEGLLKGFHSPGAVEIARVGARIVGFLTFVAGTVIFIPILNSEKENLLEIERVTWSVHAFLICLTISAQLMIIVKVRRLLFIMVGSDHGTSAVRLKQGIGASQRNLVAQCVIQVPIYLVYALVPFFFNKAEYLVPLSWLPFVPVVFNALLLHVPKMDTTQMPSHYNKDNDDDPKSMDTGSSFPASEVVNTSKKKTIPRFPSPFPQTSVPPSDLSSDFF